MYLIGHLGTSIPSEKKEVWEACVSSKPALFEECTECKRPIVIVNVVLSVTIVSYIYVELLELVTGRNGMQFYMNS